jgi:phosphoribosylglycinamide formyltransferase-1
MFGIHVQRAVLASGDEVSGPTVHRVDAEYDTGEILARLEVAVLPMTPPKPAPHGCSRQNTPSCHRLCSRSP